jgi:hypothetical protein
MNENVAGGWASLAFWSHAQSESLLHMRSDLFAAIRDPPVEPANATVRKLVNLAGKVWTHLVLNNNTASNELALRVLQRVCPRHVTRVTR